MGVGGEQVAVSHSEDFTMSVVVLWSLWLLERLNVFYLFVRLSSEPLGGRPHACLKAGTPREASTPTPTMKILVPTTVNRRSMRAEATRRAPTFKFMAKRVVRAALRALHQHREATSNPNSWTEAGTYHCLWTQCCDPRPWQWDSRTAQVRHVHSMKKQKLRRDSYSHLLPWGTNTARRACHTLVDRVSSEDARCRLTRIRELGSYLLWAWCSPAHWSIRNAHGGLWLHEAGSPPAFKSWELYSRFLFPLHLLLCLSVVLCFHCLSAILT